MARRDIFVDDRNGDLIDLENGDDLHQIIISIDSTTATGIRVLTLDLGSKSFEDFMEANEQFISSALEVDEDSLDSSPEVKVKVSVSS